MARNNTVRDVERKFLLECIELYRDLPALWKIKSKVYHDRDRKNMAYDVLLAKYNRMFPEATKDDLKKKINSLRTNYRKELKKCVNYEASEHSTYVPTLWYFQAMNFLRDEELSSDSMSLYIHTIDTDDVGKVNEEQRSETTSPILEILDLQPCQTPSYTSSTCDSKKRKKIKRPTNVSNERLSEAKDEYHHWGMACAADLRKMERTQEIYAKKAIAEIIMEAQLGLLHRHSVKINENNSSNSAGVLGTWVSQQYPNQTPSPSAYSDYCNPPSPSYKPDPPTPSPSSVQCKGQPIVSEDDCKTGSTEKEQVSKEGLPTSLYENS